MELPELKYHKLNALRKEWDLPRDKIFYFIENGILRASIWLPLRYMERGVMRDNDFVFETHKHKEGFVGVRSEDCRMIFSTGRAKLKIFKSIHEDKAILRLAYEPPQPDISVKISDLLVLREDKSKFENAYDLSENFNDNSKDEQPITEEIMISKDYRYIKLGDEEYHFGDVQARIIEQLHDAIGSYTPWVHGKTLIHGSGSHSTRLRDIFKSSRGWTKVVLSDKRGYYRLNIPLPELKKSMLQDAS